MSADPQSFKVGDLEVFFEQETGQLRYLTLGQTEIIRGIYPTIRATDWSTLAPTSFTVSVNRQGDNHVEFSHKGQIRSEKINYDYAVSVSVRQLPGKYEVTYNVKGTALADFQTCRTGLCVLHPRSLMGQRVEVEHDSEPCTTSTFPTTIMPGTPFTDVRKMTFDPAPGMHAQLEFSGDLFETEDQRNWSDPSFKTYVWPQKRGTPYTISAAKPVDLTVKLTLEVSKPTPSPLPIEKTTGRLPQMGTVIKRAITTDQISTLKALGLKHVQATMDGYETSKKIGVPVFLQSQVPSLPFSLAPSDALLLNPPQNAASHNKFRGSKKFITTLGTFGDLNRNRPDKLEMEEVDGVAFAMDPQVHMTDTPTLFECTWTLRDMIATARSFGAKQIVAGPITLKPSAVDPRMNGIESLLFTLAAMANLSVAKAEFATFFDAATLLASPAAAAFELLKEQQGKEVRIWTVEPFFVMIEADALIMVNLDWRPSRAFEQTGLESADSFASGLRGSYRLLDVTNCNSWREVLKAPKLHTPLHELPPRSVVIF
jgi:D-apionolactonase